MTDPSHQKISREAWDRGEARCHECGRPIDRSNVGPARLSQPQFAGDEEIRVYTCPHHEERTTTHFHIA